MVARQNMLAMLAAAALVAIATGENVQRNITCSGDIGVDHAYGCVYKRLPYWHIHKNNAHEHANRAYWHTHTHTLANTQK